LQYREPIRSATDPWIAMAAMAVQTERILLGPMVTPLARRRPQVVARQLVALDHLSGGRIVLGAGLGLDTSGEEFARFGENLDVVVRGEMLDEALDVLGGLLSGAQLDHRGPHFTASGVRFEPVPVHGRIPIWIAARWPNRRPLRRAARYDGVDIIDVRPSELPEAIAVIEAARPPGLGGFEVVVGDRPGADPTPWANAGATWLLATFDPFSVTLAEVRSVIRRGPPG
jgi:alkanesulfonate monooxygenase SsuD/methylene tetrahydromethanopterin reductase-like flavin-dependent oxidoreductase (luciferase family)